LEASRPSIFFLDGIFLFVIAAKLGSKSIKILYGGSVNSNNVDKLKIIAGIDGFLIGGASQNSKKFIDIIKKTIN